MEKGVDTMFKYKSPLSRLLEGAGKSKEDTAETEVIAENDLEQADQPEPIADFNALREALAGGNNSFENFEESEDLIPEGQMPEFFETDEESKDETVEEETADAPVDPEVSEEDQVVTLHPASTDAAEDEKTMLAAVAEASTEEPEDALEVQPELEVTTEPTVDPSPDFAAEEESEPSQLEEPSPEPIPVAEKEIVAPAPAEDRRARVKTTFLGFDRANTHAQELIEAAEPVAKTESAQQTFPVGWLVVTSGPGRGACVTVTEGLMQIGRNDDQAIQLDFGDTGISRSNHAVIAYDPEDRKCYLGHGGKANLVRLNGKPVLSTVPIACGDIIRISETSMRFKAFCDEGFDWRDAD